MSDLEIKGTSVAAIGEGEFRHPVMALRIPRRRAQRLTAWAGHGGRIGVLTVAVGLFAVVFPLQFVKHPLADAPLSLFVLPIALCAVRFKFWGGLIAGVVALALLIISDIFFAISLGPIGYSARVATFLVLGSVLGAVVEERKHLSERLEHYHDLSPDLLCTADLNGQFARVNPAWERVLGYSQADLISRPFIEFVHPDDRAQTEAATANLAEGIDATNFENRYRTSNGSYRWLEWNARAVIADGAIYATARDITEKKEAQDTLRQHSERLETTVRERTRELEQARLETLQRLALAAEYRDDDTQQHTDRVGQTAALIAEQLGLPARTVAVIQLAAPLHDIGKIAVSDSILLKPGKLTSEEFHLMQRHARVGANLLAGSSSEVLQLGEEIALSHHERWDGTGYPSGLRGEEIPLSGRIVAVADVFDALTHDRPYKTAWPIEIALAEIQRLSGRQFDPRIVEAFSALNHHALATLHPRKRHLAVA